MLPFLLLINVLVSLHYALGLLVRRKMPEFRLRFSVLYNMGKAAYSPFFFDGE